MIRTKHCTLVSHRLKLTAAEDKEINLGERAGGESYHRLVVSGVDHNSIDSPNCPSKSLLEMKMKAEEKSTIGTILQCTPDRQR
jgi:hypothetical protein